MFDLLMALPDTYYVFHSFAIVNKINDMLRESGTELLLEDLRDIRNREPGMICQRCQRYRLRIVVIYISEDIVLSLVRAALRKVPDRIVFTG